MQAIHEVMKDSEWTDCNSLQVPILTAAIRTEEEYLAIRIGYCGMGADVPRDIYSPEASPQGFGGNVYFNDAKPATQETNAIIDTEHTVKGWCEGRNGHWYLDTDIHEKLPKTELAMIIQRHSAWHLSRSSITRIRMEHRSYSAWTILADAEIHPLPGPVCRA